MLSRSASLTATPIESSSWNYTRHEFKDLTLVGDAAISGTGNDLANRLIGNNAANQLQGGFGHDYYNGGGGNDAIMDSNGDEIYRFERKSGSTRLPI